MGVFIGEAKVKLPEGLPDAAPEDLVLRNCAIGSGGVSGQLGIPLHAGLRPGRQDVLRARLGDAFRHAVRAGRRRPRRSPERLPPIADHWQPGPALLRGEGRRRARLQPRRRLHRQAHGRQRAADPRKAGDPDADRGQSRLSLRFRRLHRGPRGQGAAGLRRTGLAHLRHQGTGDRLQRRRPPRRRLAQPAEPVQPRLPRLQARSHQARLRKERRRRQVDRLLRQAATGRWLVRGRLGRRAAAHLVRRRAPGRRHAERRRRRVRDPQGPHLQGRGRLSRVARRRASLRRQHQAEPARPRPRGRRHAGHRHGGRATISSPSTSTPSCPRACRCGAPASPSTECRACSRSR